MQPIIYDVAVSIDGYIAGPGGDISAFPMEGPHVDAYMARLQTYGTALFGRNAYEFGYAYGMQPGDKAYPHMDHYVFSTSIELPDGSAVVKIAENWAETLDRLRAKDGPGIYLCGGGLLAGYLAEIRMISVLRLKRIPTILGSGTRLFGACSKQINLSLVEHETYQNGVVFQEYRLL